MRKALCLIVVGVFVFSLVVTSAFAVSGANVVQLAGYSAIKSASVITFPALVKNVAGAAKWLPLAVGIAEIAPLVGAVVVGTIVGGLATDLIKSAARAYFDPVNGQTVIQGNQVGYMTTQPDMPPGLNGGQFDTRPYIYFNGYTTWAQAATAANAYNMASPWVRQSTPEIYCGAVTCGRKSEWYNPTTQPFTYQGAAFLVTTGTHPVFQTYSITSLGTAVSTGDNSALPMIRAALDEINKNLWNLNGVLSPATIAAARQVLNGAVTQSQLDQVNLENPITPEDIAAQAAARANSVQITTQEYQDAVDAALKLNPSLTQAQVQAAVDAALKLNPGLTQAQAQAAVVAAMAGNPNLTQAQIQAAMSAALAANPSSGGLTQAQTQAAVKAALNDDTGVVAPVDPVIEVPSKLSLTNVMTSYMSSIASMPIVGTLRGLTINVGGSSSLCMALPSNLGGNVCYDAGGMSGALNMIGTAFLSLVTIFSFVSIFRG